MTKKEEKKREQRVEGRKLSLLKSGDGLFTYPFYIGSNGCYVLLG